MSARPGTGVSPVRLQLSAARTPGGIAQLGAEPQLTSKQSTRPSQLSSKPLSQISGKPARDVRSKNFTAMSRVLLLSGSMVVAVARATLVVTVSQKSPWPNGGSSTRSCAVSLAPGASGVSIVIVATPPLGSSVVAGNAAANV